MKIHKFENVDLFEKIFTHFGNIKIDDGNDFVFIINKIDISLKDLIFYNNSYYLVVSIGEEYIKENKTKLSIMGTKIFGMKIDLEIDVDGFVDKEKIVNEIKEVLKKYKNVKNIEEEYHYY